MACVQAAGAIAPEMGETHHPAVKVSALDFMWVRIYK